MKLTAKILAFLCVLSLFTGSGATVAFADPASPTLISASPANGATGVAVGTSVVLTFSEPIAPINASSTQWSGAGDPASIQVNGVYQQIQAVFSDETMSLQPVSGNWGNADGALVTVTIAAGGVQNLTGTGTAEAYTVSFHLADQVNPTITATTPGDNGRNISSTTSAVITFSEPIQSGDNAYWSAITVKRDGSTIVPITKAINENTLTISPLSGSWDAQTGNSYTVTIPASSVTDASGLALQAATQFTFYTVDTVRPVLQSSTPANGAKNVLPTSDITLRFSKNIQPINASHTQWTAANDPVSVQVNGTYLPIDATFSGNSVTLKPASGKWGNADGSKVTVRVNSAGIKDLSGNLTNSTDTFSFYLKDLVAPTIKSVSPADKSLKVSSASAIVITFSEPIKAGAAQLWSTISVKRNGTVVPITKSITGSTLTIQPQSGTWDNNQGYPYIVTIPAQSILDLNGLALQAGRTLSFRTIDTKKPVLTSSSPANGAKNVLPGAAIQLTFSEALAASSGLLYWWGPTDPVCVQINGEYVTTTATIKGSTITLKPYYADLWHIADGSKITVSINAAKITDVSGNTMAATSKIVYTLSDSTPPLVSDINDGASMSSISPSSLIKLTFNEKMLPGADYEDITVMNSLGDDVSITKTLKDNVLTIKPADGAWDDNRGYSYMITIPAKAVKDTSGNEMTDDYMTTFSTVDKKPPQLMEIMPKNGSKNVELDMPFVLLFDEPVSVNTETGHFTVTSSNKAKDQFTKCKWTPLLSALIIYPDNSTVWNNGYATTYTVTIPANEIKDMSGHAFSKQITAKFTTIGIADTQPGAPKAASTGYNTTQITWNKITGASKYEVWRSTSKTGKYIYLGETESTSFTDRNLTTNSTYYYKVRGYLSVDLITETKKYYSSWSAVVSAKPVPAAPVSVKAARMSANSATITWGKVDGATKYEVWRATSKTGYYRKVTVTDSTTFLNSKLTKGRTYYYKVRAYRLVGRTKVPGAWSAIVSVKP